MKLHTHLVQCGVFFAVFISICVVVEPAKPMNSLLKFKDTGEARVKMKITEFESADDSEKISTCDPPIPPNEFTADIEEGNDCTDSCFPNPSLLDKRGKIKRPKTHGNFYDVCGKTYLFSKNRMVTWEENWKHCCSLGMQPLTFNSIENQQCLIENLKDKVLDKFYVGTLLSNSSRQFWTGGFRHQITNTWTWCKRNNPTPFSVRQMNDAFVLSPKLDQENAANNQDNCPLDSRFVMQFNDASLHCLPGDSLFMMSMACESTPKVTRADLMVKEDCHSKCNVEKCSENNPTKFLDASENSLLKDRFGLGQWVHLNGFYFFKVKSVKLSQSKARQMCCNMGMSLLSVKSSAKRRTLSDLASRYPDFVGDVWTSGSDKKCNGAFRWCSVDRAFVKKEVKWGENEPNLKRGNCVTTKIHSDKSKNSLYTASCNDKKPFICEARIPSGTVEQASDACDEFLGLTQVEINNLKNVGNFTYKMKCYLKCTGDALGYITNDALNEHNIATFLSKIDSSSAPLVKDMVDKCNALKEPEDPCKRAYQLYKCGIETYEFAMQPMIGIGFSMTMAVDDQQQPILYALRNCSLKATLSCSIKPEKLVQLQKNSSIPEVGEMVKGWDQRVWFKSQYKEKYTFAEAYKGCCEIDMQLPTFSNEDVRKLYDFMDGEFRDNFIGLTETIASVDGGERWCDSMKSIEGYNMLIGGLEINENPSLLYLQKGSAKLSMIAESEIDRGTSVNYFYCQPKGDYLTTSTGQGSLENVAKELGGFVALG